jgi:acyl-CoA dehydrogenase
MTTDRNTESETRQMFVETASRLFAAQATREIINDFEKGTWPADLWRQVEEAGLPWAAVPENAGGAGGSLAA